MIRVVALLALLSVVSLGVPVLATSVIGEPRVRAGGGLAATGGSELELIGELWAEVPLASTRSRALYLELDTTTSILGADGATFTVRELLYDAALALELDARRRWRLRVGERGRQAVDTFGASRARAVMVERRSRSGFLNAWHVALGPVIETRGLLDDAKAAFDASWRVPLPGTVTMLAEVEVGGLWLDDGGLRTDTRLNLVWAPVAVEMLELVASWQRGRDPLGLGERLWLVGFRYRTDEDAARPWRARVAPDVNGAIGTLLGPRRGGRLDLEVVTPEFGPGLRLLLDLNLNTLSGDTANDLFYRYHVGVERDLRRGRAGVFYHHRSNHRLDGPIPGITSLDVLELGWAGGARQRAGRPDERDAARHALSGELRAGLLLDGDFGERRRWNLRGRGRWSPPLTLGPARLYLEAEAATGDVSRSTVGAGVALGERFDLGLARVADEQWFDEERRIWVVTARYGF